MPALLLAGVCLPFVLSGVEKLADLPAARGEFAALNLPLPAWTVALTVLLQLAGSCAVIGLRGRPAAWAAIALAGFTLAATLLAHAFWQVQGPARIAQTHIFFEHVALGAALLFVAWWKQQAAHA